MSDYSGTIDFEGDTDTFSQFLTGGRTYYIELEADQSDLDPLLRLFGFGSRIRTNDDGGDGLNSRIVFTPSVSATYEFEVDAYQDQSTGDYVLRVNEDDFRDTVDGVGSDGDVGNTLLPDAGVINFAGDADLFSTVMIQGLRYTISQTGADGGGGSLADPSLRLLDEFGDFLDANEDANGTRDSSIEYQAEYTGLAYLEAGSSSGTGGYSVDVGIGRATGRADTVFGSQSADAINGIGGNDSLYGAGGADYLFGGSGHDILRGETGADTLVGWFGRDVMIGGSGRDVFEFTAASDSAGSNIDRIIAGDGAAAMQGVGVSGGDIINLEAIDANLNIAGDQDFRFDRTGIQGLSLRSEGSVTVVRGNTDEDAAYEFVLHISDRSVSRYDYSASDFDL